MSSATSYVSNRWTSYMSKIKEEKTETSTLPHPVRKCHMPKIKEEKTKTLTHLC